MTAARRGAAAAALLLVATGSAQAQAHAPAVPAATFRFTPTAGRALGALWDQSSAAHEERVACLAADVRRDSVIVTRVQPLSQTGADSMGIGAQASIDACGPPSWRGTVHTHVAEYANGRPSARFSAQDRGVMQQWYARWHADGVFCVVYSADDAHCEADGVVGGMRSRPSALSP